MGLLTGKTALVTGAARGIGKAVAMKFASEGANIAFTDLVLNDDMAAGLEATRKASAQWLYHQHGFGSWCSRQRWSVQLCCL